MPTPRPLILLVMTILAGAMLSGCLGGEDVDLPEGDGTESGDPQFTETTGSIRGLVLTESLNAIRDARVVLIKDQSAVEDKRTDAQGRFTFNNIEPGDYRIQYSSVCCVEQVKAVRVEAGKVLTADVQLRQFTDADLLAPYIEPLEWHGFLSCGFGTPNLVGAPCGTFDENDDFLLTWNLPEGVKQVVIGMEWQPSGGIIGENLQIAMEAAGCGLSCSSVYGRGSGSSPILFTVNSPDGDMSFESIEGSREVQFRVFPEFTDASVDVFYQQPFSVHYHLFMYGESPDGYNPIPDF